jgi:transposase-like protein
MMKRQRYSKEFKRKAVQMIYDTDKPITEIAFMMKIDHSILYRWKQKFDNESEEKKITANTDGGSVEMQEIALLKKEMGVIKQDFELLRGIVEKAFKTIYVPEEK